MAHKTKSKAARRLILFGATAVAAGFALAASSEGQELPKPLSSIGAPSLMASISCHGISNVPMTADSMQSLPLQLVANVGCGEQVSILSDFEAYTVAVRTADGKSGYIARVYLSAPSKVVSRPAASSVSAAVQAGVARWEQGAPGCDQFTSEDGTVESITVNGVTVQVSLQDTGWRLRANIAIANNSAEEVRVTPSRFMMRSVRPGVRSLAYQDPNWIASAATHQIYRTASTAAPVVVETSYHQPVHITTPTNYFTPPPNPQAQFSTSPYATDSTQYDAAALLEGHVQVKSSVAGAVWFARDKHAEQVVLRVPVNGVLYEFPLSFKQAK